MPTYRVGSAVAPPGAPAPATLAFTETDGVITPDDASPLQFDLADLAGVESAGEELRLTLASGLDVRLSGMGRTASELTAALSAARRDRTAASFRFGSALGERWEECDVWMPGSAAGVRAGVRLFGSLAGIVPDCGDPAVVPFGDIRSVTFDAAAYQVVVKTAEGAAWRFGRLAKRSITFREEIERARLAFVASYQAQIEDVMPHIGELERQALSGEWREGIALPAPSLEQRSRGTAARLLEYLPSGERRQFAAALAALFPEPPRLGFYYVAEPGEARPFEPFALFQKATAAGSAVAWEELEEMGAATYVFRGPEPDLASRINAALRAVRFAREPIYLPEDEMVTTGAHRLYVPLLRRSAALQFLRQRFAGRAIHADAEAYPARVEALCAVNG
jgi:hypothetical protein